MILNGADDKPGLALAPLAKWLAEALPAVPGPFEFELIAGGHSNITYLMRDAQRGRHVLRRPPLGIQPVGAHDMTREFRIQAALGPTAVPVPELEALCEDSRVIGAPFYVMRWVEGTVVDSPAAVTTALSTAASRRAASDSVIATLAGIHRLDIDAIGLGSLGMRTDFVARQTERMRRVWEKVRTRDLPLIDSLHARLVRLRPPQRYTGLVHNDYRVGNLILGSDGRVNAVLDWELASVGDVLADIGALANNWDGPEDSFPDVWMSPAPTRAGGFPSRNEIVAAYAKQSGFDVSDLDYYRALSYWRIAIIGEGMKKRYESGEMGSRASEVALITRRVHARAELAHSLLPEEFSRRRGANRRPSC